MVEYAPGFCGELGRKCVDALAEIERLRSDNARLTAALDRLEAAYNNHEISGSLWDKEQHCYISLPVFFSRTHEQRAMH